MNKAMVMPWRVEQRPAKPTLIFDGECDFCVRWVRRWQRWANEAFVAVPLQGAEVARRWPELQSAQLEQSVHLILPDGLVWRGAAAALCALHCGGRARITWWVYRRCPGFAWLAEMVYGWVARQRGTFSRCRSSSGSRRPPA